MANTSNNPNLTTANDIFKADVIRLITDLKDGNEKFQVEMKRDNREFQVEMKKDNEKFQEKMEKGNRAFQVEMKKDNEKFQGKMEKGFNEFRKEMSDNFKEFRTLMIAIVGLSLLSPPVIRWVEPMLSTASPVASSTQTQKQNAQLLEQLLLIQKQNAQDRIERARLEEQFLLSQKQSSRIEEQFLQIVQYLQASSGVTQAVPAGRQAPAGTGPNAQSEQLVRPLPSSPPPQAQDGLENKAPEFPSD